MTKEVKKSLKVAGATLGVLLFIMLVNACTYNVKADRNIATNGSTVNNGGQRNKNAQRYGTSQKSGENPAIEFKTGK